MGVDHTTPGGIKLTGLKPPKIHRFHIPSERGVMIVEVPHTQMKRCNCGNSLFDKKYYVTWGKPAGVIGAEPICLNVEVYVCSRCGEPVTIDNPVIG
jgi:hypothetical protein